MTPVTAIILCVVCSVIFGIGGFFLGTLIRKKIAEGKIGSAEQEAKRIVDEAARDAETTKKDALLQGREQILKERTETERELKEQKAELTRQERRLVSKEENLDKKSENLDKKNEQLTQKLKEADELKEQINETLAQHLEMLQKVSGYTAEEAKAELIQKIENEVRHDAVLKIIEIESNLKEEADQKAKDIISLAIQRCASEHVSETTVSTVTLPNEEMKGRIIGREGRNIRTIEQLTGVDLIIDDTPEAITVSCFDPVRREVARMTLEKLISDGRIHPTRIEETVNKAQKEIEATIKKAGESAVFEIGIHSLNPELVKLLGRLKYRTSYGQNVLTHSLEVAYLSGIIADELGVDSVVAKRAGLLHDIGKAMTAEVEGSHVQLGVDIATKYKESRDVIHAIEAHHNDVEPQTIIAIIVQAADAISAARPGARRENIENYIKRLQKLEEIATSFNGVEKSYALQAGREVRVIVKPEEVNDEQMVLIARDIVKKIEENLEYPGQIKINVIRESRATDYAK